MWLFQSISKEHYWINSLIVQSIWYGSYNMKLMMEPVLKEPNIKIQTKFLEIIRYFKLFLLICHLFRIRCGIIEDSWWIKTIILLWWRSRFQSSSIIDGSKNVYVLSFLIQAMTSGKEQSFCYWSHLER